MGNNKPPHPLISYGNDFDNKVKGVFEKGLKDFPKEANKNHVSVGGSVSFKSEFSYYNPHNARFYFEYIKTDPLTDPRFKTINKSEKSIDFLGCRFVVKKKFIEVTNKVNKDRRFKIEGSLEQRKNLCAEAVATLEKEVIASLKSFVREFGGKCDFVCVKMWIPDNKILHDNIVDRIPLETTFRNEVVKKVYNDSPKNVEFSSPALASNYFRNSGLNDFAPQIASELESLRKEIMSNKSFLTPLQEVKLCIQSFPDDVLKNKEPIKHLSESDKSLLSFWFFEEFGVKV